jgi:hypothetical protein
MNKKTGFAAAPWVLALALLAAWPAHAEEEAAVIKRTSELREAPGDTGRAVATLAADSAVTRLGDRQGAWVKVRTGAGAVGWLHMFDIAPASASGSGGAAGALRSVTSLFSKPTAQRTTTATATIGIRGLGAEDIAQAQPDVPAVGRMEALRASDTDARQFARQAPLAAVSVEPLPAPARAAATTSGTGDQR